MLLTGSPGSGPRWLLLLAGAVLLLTGCGGEAGPSGGATYAPPGWMAEQAQRQDEYRQTLQECADRKGWNVTITGQGGVVEPFDDVDYPRWEADRDACRVEMGLDPEPGPLSRDLAELLYERLGDTWACVRSHGYSTAPAPSREAYVEDLLAADAGPQDGAAAWGPYGDLVHELPAEELEQLLASCPEPWWAG